MTPTTLVCAEASVRAITSLDPRRYGNSAHHHRYSFGRACTAPGGGEVILALVSSE
jgi:hypothetical protein